MILDRPFPPDRRVEKEATALKRAGHALYLLAAGHGDFGAGHDIEVGPIHVRYVPELRGWKRLRNSYDFQRTLRNRHWRGPIARFVSEFKIDVVHVHDLPLLATTLSVARSIHLPVVADLRAHYPTLVELRRARVAPWMAAFLAPARRWIGYEARSLAEAVHILVNADEARQYLIDKHPLWPDAITTILDAEEVTGLAPKVPGVREDAGNDGELILVAAGGHGDSGGLETAVEALAVVCGEQPRTKLIVVGADSFEVTRLQKAARRAGVSDRLDLHPVLPPGLLQSEVVALLPCARNMHTDTVLPHELFVYMLLALPVVASDCVPLKRVIEATGCGVVFRAGDAGGLAEEILRLGADAKLRRAYGAAGRRASESDFNWEREARKLQAVYERINRERPLPPPGSTPPSLAV